MELVPFVIVAKLIRVSAAQMELAQAATVTLLRIAIVKLWMVLVPVVIVILHIIAAVQLAERVILVIVAILIIAFGKHKKCYIELIL